MKRLAMIGWIGICLGVVADLVALYAWRISLSVSAWQWGVPAATFAFLCYAALFSRSRSLIAAAAFLACATKALDFGWYVWGPDSAVAMGYIPLLSLQVLTRAAWAVPFVVFTLRVGLRKSFALSQLDVVLAWLLALAALVPLGVYAGESWDFEGWRQIGESLQRPAGLYAFVQALYTLSALGAALFFGALAWAQTKRKVPAR